MADTSNGDEDRAAARSDRAAAGTDRAAAGTDRVAASADRTAASEDRASAKSDRETATTDRKALAENKKTQTRRYYTQAAVYLVIVLVGAFGFYRTDKAAEAGCESDAEIVSAVVDNVDAVYDLAVGSIQPRKDKDGNDIPWTDEEQAQIDAYLERLKDYKDKQHKELEGIPVGCYKD